jgi:helix-turn-helix protein
MENQIKNLIRLKISHMIVTDIPYTLGLTTLSWEALMLSSLHTRFMEGEGIALKLQANGMPHMQSHCGTQDTLDLV